MTRGLVASVPGSRHRLGGGAARRARLRTALTCACLVPLALLVGQQMLAPRTMKVFRASEGDIASATVRGYAAEAYPAYRAAAPTRPCPASLDELDGGTRAHRDPWGTPYAMDCTRDRIVVVSAGPDGMFDTDDDIGSNQ